MSCSTCSSAIRPSPVKFPRSGNWMLDWECEDRPSNNRDVQFHENVFSMQEGIQQELHLIHRPLVQPTDDTSDDSPILGPASSPPGPAESASAPEPSSSFGSGPSHEPMSPNPRASSSESHKSSPGPNQSSPSPQTSSAQPISPAPVVVRKSDRICFRPKHLENYVTHFSDGNE
ncbi:unnamed protein product [Linum trigynum]|uniref:Uncharacterized protein n=1 Tax=Linum trigynum TaxID=586398 RepID=A0AAV2CZP9_9ROSI